MGYTIYWTKEQLFSYAVKTGEIDRSRAPLADLAHLAAKSKSHLFRSRTRPQKKRFAKTALLPLPPVRHNMSAHACRQPSVPPRIIRAHAPHPANHRLSSGPGPGGHRGRLGDQDLRAAAGGA